MRLDIRSPRGDFIETVEGSTVAECLSGYYDFTIMDHDLPMGPYGYVHFSDDEFGEKDLIFGPEENGP